MRKNVFLKVTAIFLAILLLASTPLAAVKVAVITPHPDDETIGLGGWMQWLKANGDYVHCTLMTDGSATKSQLVDYYGVAKNLKPGTLEWKKAIREDSFKRVMNIYGLPYWTMGIRDAQLTSTQVYNRLKSLYVNYGFTHFYVVCKDGNSPHRDHVACQEGLRLFLKAYPKAKGREFCVHYYKNPRQPLYPLPYISKKDQDISKYKAKKTQAFQVYWNIKEISKGLFPYSEQGTTERIYYIN